MRAIKNIFGARMYPDEGRRGKAPTGTLGRQVRGRNRANGHEVSHPKQIFTLQQLPDGRASATASAQCAVLATSDAARSLQYGHCGLRKLSALPAQTQLPADASSRSSARKSRRCNRVSSSSSPLSWSSSRNEQTLNSSVLDLSLGDTQPDTSLNSHQLHSPELNHRQQWATQEQESDTNPSGAPRRAGGERAKQQASAVSSLASGERRSASLQANRLSAQANTRCSSCTAAYPRSSPARRPRHRHQPVEWRPGRVSRAELSKVERAIREMAREQRQWSARQQLDGDGVDNININVISDADTNATSSSFLAQQRASTMESANRMMMVLMGAREARRSPPEAADARAQPPWAASGAGSGAAPAREQRKCSTRSSYGYILSGAEHAVRFDDLGADSDESGARRVRRPSSPLSAPSRPEMILDDVRK